MMRRRLQRGQRSRRRDMRCLALCRGGGWPTTGAIVWRVSGARHDPLVPRTAGTRTRFWRAARSPSRLPLLHAQDRAGLGPVLLEGVEVAFGRADGVADRGCGVREGTE